MAWDDGVGQETCGKEDQSSTDVGRPESWSTTEDKRWSERKAKRAREGGVERAAKRREEVRAHRLQSSPSPRAAYALPAATYTRRTSYTTKVPKEFDLAPPRRCEDEREDEWKKVTREFSPPKGKTGKGIELTFVPTAHVDDLNCIRSTSLNHWANIGACMKKP